MNLQLDLASKVEVWAHPGAYVENGKRVPGKSIHAEWADPNRQQRTLNLYHGMNPFEHRDASMDGGNPLYVG